MSPVLTPEGLVPITDPETFTLSLLVEEDPAVDVPVQLVAEWSGHPSLSDTPRVQPEATPLQPPYIASLIFSSLKPKDFGVYMFRVVMGDDSREGLVSSIPLDVNVTFSLGERQFVGRLQIWATAFTYSVYILILIHRSSSSTGHRFNIR